MSVVTVEKTLSVFDFRIKTVKSKCAMIVRKVVKQ